MRRRVLLNNINRPYLRVEDTSPKWVTVDNPVIYNVISNTNWYVNVT